MADKAQFDQFLGALTGVGPRLQAMRTGQVDEATKRAALETSPQYVGASQIDPRISGALGLPFGTAAPGASLRPEDISALNYFDPYNNGTNASLYSGFHPLVHPTLAPPVATPDTTRAWLEQQQTLALQQNPALLFGAGGANNQNLTGYHMTPHGWSFDYSVYPPPPRTLPPPPPPKPGPSHQGTGMGGASLGPDENPPPDRTLPGAQSAVPQDGDPIAPWPGEPQGGKYAAATRTITTPDGRQYYWDPKGNSYPVPMPPMQTRRAATPAAVPAQPPTPTPPTPSAAPPPPAPSGTATAAPPPAPAPGTPPAATPAPAPLSPELGAAQQRLEQKYAPGPVEPAYPSPAFTVAPPPPVPGAPPTPVGVAPTPNLPAPRPQAQLPGPPAEGAVGYPPSAPVTPPASAQPAPTPAAQPQPPNTQEAQPPKPSDPQLAGDIRDAMARYPEFRKQMEQDFGMPANEIPDASLLNNMLAVNQGYRARGDRALEQKTREAGIKGTESDVSQARQAHLARTELHDLFMAPVGTAPDGRTVIGMDAAAKDRNWAYLANVPGVGRLIGPAADMPRPGLPRSLFSIEDMANTPALGPWQKAASNFLQGKQASISIARSLGASGRINQTELNILNKVSIPSESSTYAHAMQQYHVLDKFLADVENNVPEAQRTANLQKNAQKLEAR